MGSSPALGHRFEPWLRPRCHQCLWIHLTAASTWVKVARLPCCIHTYTVYTSIGGKGKCHTRHDLWDHCTQARKSAGERSTLDLKPVRKDTRSPKQEQSVAPQTGPSPNKKLKKKKGMYEDKGELAVCFTLFYLSSIVHCLVYFGQKYYRSFLNNQVFHDRHFCQILSDLTELKCEFSGIF